MPARQARLDVVERRVERTVSSSVFAPGCFWMPMMTAGIALCEPSPRLIASPTRTRATSRTSTGRPSRTTTTVCAMSSMVARRPTPCMRYSWPLGHAEAGARVPVAARDGALDDVEGQPWCASAAGSATTWYCFCSPPVDDDLRDARHGQQPPPHDRLGRRAEVESECRSDSSSTNRISPMIDETGARTGRSTPSGQGAGDAARASRSRSAGRERCPPPSRTPPTRRRHRRRWPSAPAARRRRRSARTRSGR